MSDIVLPYEEPQFIYDGDDPSQEEYVTPDVANRAGKQIQENVKFLKDILKQVSSSAKDLVDDEVSSDLVDGDFVYKNSDGKYYKAIDDGTLAKNVIGVYREDSNGNKSIVLGGFIPMSGLQVGMRYYLSDEEAGKISTEGSIPIGIAIDENNLLLDIDTSSVEKTEGMVIHPNVITKDYAIPEGYNAISAGPITIEDDVTVTIPEDSTWVIV